MYSCPCCGYRVLEEKPPGSYLVCPICFWEDTEEVEGLRQARLNFVRIGACAPDWLEQVRCPTARDVRDPNWQLLDEKIKNDGSQIIQQAIGAFKNVKLSDGISLNEAREIYLISDYAYNFSIYSLEAKSLLANVRTSELNSSWQTISEEKLKTSLNSFVTFYYLDAKGWRYYFPAYIVWSLDRYLYHNVNYFYEVICVFLMQKEHYVFDRKQGQFYQQNKTEYFATMTAEQHRVICQFLKFIANYATGYRQEAEEILEQYCKSFNK